MKKSMYSLMLFDELVEAIDQLAYLNSTNRSQIINEIMAEKLGLMTPKQKINNILDGLVNQLKGMKTLKIHPKSELGQLEVGSFIKYKYNPAIKYQIESGMFEDNRLLILKVSSRTTSTPLLERLDDFFNRITEIDQKRFEEFYGRKVIYKLNPESNQMFMRQFLTDTPFDLLEETYLSKYLSLYIKMLDEALGFYFSHLKDKEIQEQLDKIYCKHIKQL